MSTKELLAPGYGLLLFFFFGGGGVSLPQPNFSLPQQPSAQTADLTSKVPEITYGPIISRLLLFTKFAFFFVKKLHYFNTLSCEIHCLMVSCYRHKLCLAFLFVVIREVFVLPT